MKLLSVCLANHDANISYYDGKELHYYKPERTKNVKRFWYKDLWSWKYDIEKLWNIDINDIDQIVLNIECFTFDRYHHLLSNESKVSFEKLFSGECHYLKLGPEFTNILGVDNNKLYAISHYYGHALSTHFVTDKDPDVYIVIDCLGDAYRSWSVYRDDKLIDTGIWSEGSIGEEINNMGRYLNIQADHDVEIAGKLMGLQSYGKIDYTYLHKSDIYDMSSVKELYSFDRYLTHKGDSMISKYTALDWARTIHDISSKLLVNFFKKYASSNDTIFYAGGVAQNVVWNTELRKHFPNLVVAPHSSDEGISLGGIEFLRQLHNLKPIRLKNFPYSQSDIGVQIPTNDTVKLAAKMLAYGKTVAWYQGNGEIGPRALGNRSILMDPRIPDGKKIINQIKNRENYRPFGASVLKEKMHDWFYIDDEDPYMVFTSMVKNDILKSITHVDGTCRVQTVDDRNPIFKSLLEEFYDLTECPVLLNTSLNMAGQSLAGYPESALELFANTRLDCLFIGNKFYYKD